MAGSAITPPNASPGTVLITGGTGSFGSRMVADLLARGCREVRILSRDEEKQDRMRSSLRHANLRFYLGDIRDRDSLDRAMAGAECVFHAAALKQVPSCEFFPVEAVRTNVLGSENVLRAAVAAGVGAVVCLSSDKAVLPVNAMGLSKAMMEKLAQAQARTLGATGPRISVVRYGNVIGSRGSVIPLFIRQIRAGHPLTVTEPHMTRFLMPFGDSIGLVHHAFRHARQGDVFIRKAVSATLGDLVAALCTLCGVPDHPVEVIGARHGEKLYETLATAQELDRAEDMGPYLRLAMDGRDLNYTARTERGDGRPAALQDYHSHNAPRLDAAGVAALLRTLPEIQAELWPGRAVA